MTQHCMTEKGLVVPHIYLCSFFERETGIKAWSSFCCLQFSHDTQLMQELLKTA